MTDDVKLPFPYPGGKSQYANQIIQRFPDHTCYVEVFGGAGSVLFQKERSAVEVYNDFNSDVVTFFEVARESPDDLEAYLSMLPYSRELFDEISDRWYVDGDRPDDDIQRAAEFLYLRITGHGSLFRKTGFSASHKRSHPGKFINKVDQIQAIADRLRTITIENRDWSDVVDKYDGGETLFYFDPPYVDITDDGLYAGEPTTFDHDAFVDRLATIDGQFIVSYADLPPALDTDEYHLDSHDQRWSMAAGRQDDEVYTEERLVMNFDPDEWPRFAGATQATLDTLQTDTD